jgi:hypothetical protein
MNDILETVRAAGEQHARQKRQKLIAVVCVVLALSVLALDAYAPLGIAAGVLYGAIILLSLWMPSVNPFVLAAITGALTLLEMLKLHAVAPMWVVATNRALSIAVQLAAAFAVWAQRSHERDRHLLLQRLEQELEQVRRLEGLLRICAWCKRVRNGSGHWQPVEVYVRDHSDADFSHGACPDCSERVLRESRDRAGQRRP